jgi:PAS domain S-box-containing protein
VLYIAEAGASGRWLYVSSGIEVLLGYSAREWMDDPDLWASRIDPRDRDRVLAREDEQAEPSIPDEYRMRRRCGTTVWVRDEAALVPDDAGSVRWHGVISDISDRKIGEQELALRARQQAEAANLGAHALAGAAVSALIDEALASVVRLDSVAAAAVLELCGDDGALAPRARSGPWPLAELDVLRGSNGGSAPRGDAGASPPPARSSDTAAFPIATAKGRWGELVLRRSGAGALEAAAAVGRADSGEGSAHGASTPPGKGSEKAAVAFPGRCWSVRGSRACGKVADYQAVQGVGPAGLEPATYRL